MLPVRLSGAAQANSTHAHNQATSATTMFPVRLPNDSSQLGPLPTWSVLSARPPSVVDLPTPGLSLSPGL